nr:EOG090X07NR [Macrothrix elegans]
MLVNFLTPERAKCLRHILLSRSRWTSRGSSRPQLNRRVELTPAEANPSPQGQGRLAGPIAFTAVFSASCLTLSAIWEYENMRTKALQFRQKATNWMQAQTQKQGNFRNHLNIWWNSLSEEQKLFFGILVANTTVLLAWRAPSLKNFMVTYFCSNPFSRAVCWPMVLSTFSHYSFLHFGVNMYVLHSFMNGATHSMGKEQFLGFYLSAGVVSSLSSHIFKTMSRLPGISLGASGAIMGVLGYFCSQHPNAILQVAFIPGFTFTADTGLKSLLCIDTLGLLMRWRLFDHAAHLGGALFGIFWQHWGQQEIWNRRVGILQAWHNFRTGVRPGE